ncbi:MAG: hypothetical protein AVDCRST_MAG73-3476 [uncultured Thermomicrobiales bacterium]|uniref:Uncharacterized protein n=1 Tax=uncultured Thermomicrobiales bacterium TaxID=1645740 RepID=A0A6J4UUG5_9BACT|nr:MAG: hypothetical protein AVDCRST_MAG73-3476 [uncultured Thermomicrobiales bacterium]
MAWAVQQQAILLDGAVVTDEQADALIAQSIVPNPHKPGRHEAKVDAKGGCPSVWEVISIRSSGESVAEGANNWNLPEDAVRAAIACSRRHRAPIDVIRLLPNEGWMA